MQTTYTDRLNALVTDAKDAILHLVEEKKTIFLFEKKENDDEEEWTEDIYAEIPDFTFYNKHGYTEAAAIKEIRFEENDVKITGILKGDNYPILITVYLSEMDCWNLINLADYLLSENN